MRDMPKISIIVPIYNTEVYLRQCLDSILAQTHQDIEVICVDDRTPDGSVDIVRDYMAGDDRLRLLSHSVNKGLGPARNTGIQAATGEVIGFVDSDDWVDPEMFATLWAVMDREEADIVQCSARRIKNGNDIGSYPKSAGTRDSFVMHSMFGEGPRLVGAAWNKIYRTRIFHDNGITYPPILFEDVATTPRLVHLSKRVSSVTESYLNYRFRDDSIVNSVNPDTLVKRIDGLLKAAEVLGGFFNQRNAHSLEFILNLRTFMLRQIENNLRTAQALPEAEETLERCHNVLRARLSNPDRDAQYFFPDQTELLERFGAQ